MNNLEFAAKLFEDAEVCPSGKVKNLKGEADELLRSFADITASAT